MHWGIGKIILQVSQFVKRHPQLFATYVTNFSCGPDSFLISYFRDEMGKKPSLTLELDSHTADVGLNTRIEAAIDIIKYYRQLNINYETKKDDYRPSKIVFKGTRATLLDSQGKEWNMRDPNVTFLFPRMGRFTTEAGVAALNGLGYTAKIAKVPDMTTLSYGKSHSSCKECLPYILCLGSLVEYIKLNKKENEKVVFFTVGDVSPCRVEQYQVGFKRYLEKNKIKDVAIITLTSEDAYAGMGLLDTLAVFKAFILSDAMQQIYSVLLALAEDKTSALQIYENEWAKILDNFYGKEKISLYKRFMLTAKELSKIKLTKSFDKASRITVIGEIYVRNEEFSRQSIENILAKMGFITKIVPLIEWINYVDHTKWNNFSGDLSILNRAYFFIKRQIQHMIEKKIKNIFKASKMYVPDPIDIQAILDTSKDLVDNKLLGEVGLTIGVGLKEILKSSCGIISLSPFSCLQARSADAILTNNMVLDRRLKVNTKSVFGDSINDMDQKMPLPFLSIESDGNPFPQLIEARLEVFELQARRLGNKMNKT
jgi:predicted nucleotide-binding protein (sugar kinase/HSP70/actin superfamily)